MNGSLRLMILEDNPADADLMVRALRAAGYAVHPRVVENESMSLLLSRLVAVEY